MHPQNADEAKRLNGVLGCAPVAATVAVEDDDDVPSFEEAIKSRPSIDLNADGSLAANQYLTRLKAGCTYELLRIIPAMVKAGCFDGAKQGRESEYGTEFLTRLEYALQKSTRLHGL